MTVGPSRARASRGELACGAVGSSDRAARVLWRYNEGVHYREHAPPPELACYVTCFWQVTTRGGAHRVLPDGAMDIVFALGAARARVVGPMTRAIEVATSEPSCVVGVRFRPGAASGVLGLAARELRDTDAEGREAWGARGRELDAQLADARDPRSALDALAAAVATRVKEIAPLDARVERAVRAIARAGGSVAIPVVAADAGLGERQLERLFDERVGYRPKTFARVARLQRATAALARGASSGAMSWAQLAVDCGYADQAHLIREFRALAGVTPAVYARSAAMSEIDNPAHRVPPTFGA